MILIAGMYFGFRLRENTPAGTGFFKTDKKTSLQEILDLVKTRYVDSVNLDSLQLNAINEMMNELDPHSVFIPSGSLQEINDDMAGNFEGIGVEFNFFYDTVHIVHVLANGPSDKAGLQVGDKLLKVNNENITGPAIKTEDVKKRIKGPRGTSVDILVLRNSEAKEFKIIRGTIPLPALDDAYMLDINTGYIKMNKFSETAYEEFMKALEGLQKNPMKKLVLDLRDNGGGLMNEAVDIADEFLSDDKLVVFTEGQNVKRREYRCKRPGLFEEGELVVLVDELSASASEVLAGALQDWDRAIIIGRRTFGKGLVQEQYSLHDGGAIRLTVARCFTPVGRRIQRSYNTGKTEYRDAFLARYNNGERAKATRCKTGNKKMDRTTLKTNRLFNSGALNKFMYKYYLQQRSELNNFKNTEEFLSGYNNQENAWKALVEFSAKDTIDLKNISSEDKAYVQKRIKAHLARYQWRTEGYYEVLNSFDPAIKKAMEELAKTKKQPD